MITYEITASPEVAHLNEYRVESNIPVSVGDIIIINIVEYRVVEVKKYLTIDVVKIKVTPCL